MADAQEQQFLPAVDRRMSELDRSSSADQDGLRRRNASAATGFVVEERSAYNTSSRSAFAAGGGEASARACFRARVMADRRQVTRAFRVSSTRCRISGCLFQR